MDMRYAERLGPGLLQEPVNCLSSLALLLAAFLAWRSAHRARITDPGLYRLIAVVPAIACGSILWHSVARPWAQLADLLPILVFQLLFLHRYLTGIGLGRGTTAFLLVAFTLVTALMPLLPPSLNGAPLFLPTLIVLGVLAVVHRRLRRPGPWLLAVAWSLATVSLAFRSLDLVAAELIPWGTHFLWHLGCAALIWVLLRTLILAERVAPEPP